MAELARSMSATPEPVEESHQEDKQEKQQDVKTANTQARGHKASRTAPAPGRTRRRSTGTLKQMTIKLAPDVRGRLLQESLRRKSEDSENWPIQQIVTEAVNAYLGGK